jgi:anti-sigma factor RsiW
MMDGELAEPYASQYKAQKEKAKEWDRMVEDLRKRVANTKPEPVPDDL